jgi:hypothetical protein
VLSAGMFKSSYQTNTGWYSIHLSHGNGVI